MTIALEIFSDLVCPWCYIGKRRLDAALRSANVPAPTIEWKAFQLSPDLPTEGIDRAQYMERKFGKDAARQMSEELSAIGQDEGIEFHFDRIRRTPNTFLAHRLIWLAKQTGLQSEVVEGLFAAYFSKGLDIGDPAVLGRVAMDCGIPLLRVEDFFQSAQGKGEVQKELQRARELGITMVPFFLFHEKDWITGADTIETFERVLRELASSGTHHSDQLGQIKAP